ncbi:hypothetical protein JB92DRAFT_3147113 [Gautieria morchelliformis]|nr:hypothetical protein JB92DRAFT_3147113 [Gautieria morchelliformis]
MKFFSNSTILSLTCLAGYATFASAAANVNECSVTHGSSGNSFTISVAGVADASESTICGHSAGDIFSSASSFSTKVVSKVDCHTASFGGDQNTMSLTVTLNKQSPAVQLQALTNGITAAFGIAGVSFPSSVCDLSGVPARRMKPRWVPSSAD